MIQCDTIVHATSGCPIKYLLPDIFSGTLTLYSYRGGPPLCVELLIPIMIAKGGYLLPDLHFLELSIPTNIAEGEHLLPDLHYEQ